MKVKKEIYLIGTLSALVSGFFAKVIFLKNTFFLGCIMNSFQPWWTFSIEGIKNGTIYLWNPYLFSGQPFIANIQTALFYPFKLLFCIFGYNLGFKIFVVLHIFLAGLFMYLLARKLEISKESSFVSCLIFAFGGYLLVQIEFFSAMGSCIWLPLVFLFLKNTLKNKKNLFFIFISGITLSFQFFSGYTQVLLYTIVALFLYVLVESIYESANSKRYFFIFLIIGVISFAISLIHFLPVLEGVLHSTRVKISFKEAITWSLPPFFLVKFLLPSLFGKICAVFLSKNPFGTDYWPIRQYWLTTFYIGILPLFFSLIALIFKKRNKIFLYLFLLSMIALIFALGRNPLFYLFFSFNPLVQIFTHYASFMYLAVFPLILLAAMGMDYFLYENSEKGALIFQKPLYSKEKKLLFFIKTCFISLFCIIGFFLIFWKKQRLLLFTPFQQGWIQKNLLFLFIFVIISLIILYLKKKFSLPFLKILIISFITVDLFIFGIGINPTIADWFFKVEPINLKFIKNNLGFSRIFFTPQAQTNRIMMGNTYEMAYKSLRDALQLNVGLPYHIFNGYGYDFIPISYYRELLYKMKEKCPIFDTKVINVLGGRYIFSYQDLNSQKLNLVRSDKIKIYENRNYFPRAFIVPEVKIMPRKEILNYLLSAEFKPRKEVIIEKPSSKSQIPISNSQSASGGPIPNYKDNVQIVKYEPNEVAIECFLEKCGWLVLTDTYYPGWQVYINGKRGKIYRADYALRAVHLDKGTSKVKFIYEPMTFEIGLYFTLFVLSTLGILGVKFCFRYF